KYRLRRAYVTEHSMAANAENNRRKFIAFILATAFVALALYVFYHWLDPVLRAYLAARMPTRMPGGPITEDNLLKVPKLILWSLLAYLGVRALNTILFEFVVRIRRGYEAPTLLRNIVTLVTFTILFVVIFKLEYPDVELGALFTTSAIFGVIIGLALQDTLGNFFAGISLHADRPFQVGDVIVVGQQKHTGVVEGITWRAIKIRTFQNHIVRIRGLGDSSIDWEIKYWLDDYAKYNDTDALVRQRVWYALRRNGLTFAFPTRTLYLEKSVPVRPVTVEDQIADRLSAVDIFSPLSTDELRQLAKATAGHVFAPGETLIRAGEEGSSMFVVHSGRVAVQVPDKSGPRTVA